MRRTLMFVYILVLYILVILCLSGCRTAEPLSIVRPVPPQYVEVSDDVPVPVEVMTNTIYMLDYIERLEVYADNLETLLYDV